MDIRKGDKFNVFPVFVGFYAVIFAVACKQGEGIRLDNEGIDDLGIEIVDTLTVDVRTFLLDPLPTAATGRILVGSLRDEALGELRLSSYFRISNSELNLSGLPADAVYDSLSLRLFYDGYYYGDTTAQLQLTLHRLSEDLERSELPIALEDDEYPVFVSGETLWSDQLVAFEPTALGTANFLPRPLSTSDTIAFKLDDAVGRTLFDMAVNNDTRLTNAEDFVDFFKGLTLMPVGDNKCIVGLRDSLSLNLHYSYERQSDGMRVSDTLRLTMGSTDYQYNHVKPDRQGSLLEGLSAENNQLPESATLHRTFIQGSSGIVTRLRFPTARQFINSANIAVSKAQLIIETDQPVHALYPPPASLVMMVANQYGTPTSLLTGGYAETTQTAYYQATDQAGGAGNGKYVFDLTEYISEMRNSTSSESESLLLTIPTADLMATVNRLAVANQGNKPAIKLYLLYVKF
ncbi:DUF4270 family protein [Parapedobacter indicus]|uniref:DUF4270 domain-containing protein n=1 Tax=Parapedobacter indicus TaxID=1477437 RepID=A0A1I3M1Y2_9SPHI|nr:DUF4270 family protein [Parapedobacter indicus]PPL01306.1 uncharacterized protein DUF4270 [Parapedobacter indicus]SFI91019.1 protein of unknown function [Parapedobacter indicus]